MNNDNIKKEYKYLKKTINDAVIYTCLNKQINSDIVFEDRLIYLVENHPKELLHYFITKIDVLEKLIIR